MKHNRLLKSVVLAALGVVLVANPSRADDGNSSAPPNAITGVVDVTQGAINQLEDELAKHVAQSTFHASDYAAWNTQFRARLNQDLVTYEKNLDSQIVQKLEPLSDRYKAIVGDQSLRDDQRQFLAQTEFNQLQQQAASLAGAYQALYADLLRDLMGFLPTLKITYVGGNSRGIFGWGGSQDTYHYDLASLDGTGKTMSADFGIADIGPTRYCVWYDSHGYESDCTYYPALFQNLIPSEYQSQSDAYSLDGGNMNKFLTGNSEGGWAVIDALIAQNGQPDPIMTNYVAPSIEQGCQSQICLLLKSSDLLLTFNTLNQQLDQPFVVSFADNPSDASPQNTVTIPAAVIDSDAYTTLLSQPVTDNSLPFDTSK